LSAGFPPPSGHWWPSCQTSFVFDKRIPPRFCRARSEDDVACDDVNCGHVGGDPEENDAPDVDEDDEDPDKDSEEGEDLEWTQWTPMRTTKLASADLET